ncbi:hypothetical protein EXIGLDRAFT_772129 [Exidia glandulosa HHB12029]|uniref:F-box domain-containing protein n=1 Tax=Exidia glandulosa HHB12029 TaxID=1314781 RepID=A0A166A6X4_EXIGL|nr:hypothetical protein EXIGLDRAFT_772129 [Exidia glandulosa HHB12029]
MLPASTKHESVLHPYEPWRTVQAVDGATVREQDEGTVATIEELEATLEHLDASLATARPDFENHVQIIAQMTLDREALRASIDASRENLRNTLAVFPFDVLAPIFTLVHESSSTTRKYADWRAMRVPYVLASVCRGWRRVALATPILWRYIAVSTDVPRFKNCISFYQHLGRIIARSGTRSLDVDIDVSEKPFEFVVDVDATISEFWSRCFAKLVPAVSRLRTLHVNGGHNDFESPLSVPFRAHLQNLLSCPTPLLENLDLIFRPRFLEGPDEPVSCFLPDAPSLRRLGLHGVPFIPSLPRAVLSSLTHLALGDMDVFLNQLWETLSPALNLETLDMEMCAGFQASRGPIVRRPDSLPIRELHVIGGIMDDIFASPPPAMPNLTTLWTVDWNVTEFIVTDALAHSLTHLRLELQAHHVAESRKRHLNHIRDMRSLLDVWLEYKGSTQDEEKMLYDELCDPDRPMWPQVRTLKITGLCAWDVSDDERDGLLRLLRFRMRNTPSSTSTPVPIESVSFDSQSVPAWVAVEVRAVLGENCHQL